jgi:predicted nucleotide-binding protein (sugar kinase/HSP70/actin superfamily)
LADESLFLRSTIYLSKSLLINNITISLFEIYEKELSFKIVLSENSSGICVMNEEKV